MFIFIAALTFGVYSQKAKSRPNAKREPVARSSQIRTQRSIPRLRDAVEQHAFDAHVIVEVLEVTNALAGEDLPGLVLVSRRPPKPE